MKYLLFSLMFACSMNAQTMKSNEGWRLYHHDTPMVGKSQYGGIFVDGDSVKAIKALLKLVEKFQIQDDKKTRFINSGIIWSNTVPDYLKQSKEWIKYQKQFKNYGIKPSRK